MQQRKTRTLRLPSDLLALVERKQRFLRQWRGAYGLREKEQLSRLHVAGRSRQRSSARSQEGETGGTCWRSRTCSLPRPGKSNVCNCQATSVQAPPRVTVRQQDGSPTWDHDDEVGARRDAALVAIFGAEPLWLKTAPQLSQAKAWVPPETCHLQSGGRAGGLLRSCLVERLVRAFGVEAQMTKTSLEERMRSSGTQWLDSVRRLQYRHVHRPSQQHEQRQRQKAAFRKKTKMLRLHSCSSQAKTLEMQKIGELSRCSATVEKAWPKASINTSTCACSREGCRPTPVWLAPRKEHASCSSHPGKHAVSSQVSCLTPFRGIVHGQRSQMPQC